MNIKRSSRHALISGNFGEALILYWLSKDGFECAKVDHTGIDIIAKNPHTNELMGISVKCRTRSRGKENDSVTIRKSDLVNIEEACQAFECQPYFAIVVDANFVTRVFITSKKNFFNWAPAKCNCYWRMTKACLEGYKNDERVISFMLDAKVNRWWETSPLRTGQARIS